MNTIKIKFLDNGQGIYELKKATKGSAGFDLKAAVSKPVIIKSRYSVLIPCGISIALPPNLEAQVRPRSGLALKNQITVLNSPGTIDSDYRGEICTILINHGSKKFEVQPKMRISQIIFAEVANVKLQEVSTLDKTNRGESGFGSTGLE
tara:strand:- start:2651 stop:3097 length:447 start_codon:yes stop_codon:yes gene_type:complete